MEGVKDNILWQYHELEARHQALSVAHYNTDHVYRKLVEEMLDTLAWAHDAIEVGGQRIYLREAHRYRVRDLERKLRSTQAGSSEARGDTATATNTNTNKSMNTNTNTSTNTNT